MKRRMIIYLVTIFGIMLIACLNENSIGLKGKMSIEPQSSNVEESNVKCINSYGKELYNYSTESINELKKWLANTESKESNNGAFKEIIDLYRDQCKTITVPKIDGEEVTKIFVDSNKNTINYVYSDPSIRVCIEPIDVKENNKYDKKDVRKFMVDKYEIEFDKKEDIVSTEEQNRTGYEYNKILYQYKNIELGTKKRECVIGHMYSEKSQNQHIINFIEQDVLVKIIYFDNNEGLNLEGLGSLSFENMPLE